jgi:hypothetical protein
MIPGWRPHLPVRRKLESRRLSPKLWFFKNRDNQGRAGNTAPGRLRPGNAT